MPAILTSVARMVFVMGGGQDLSDFQLSKISIVPLCNCTSLNFFEYLWLLLQNSPSTFHVHTFVRLCVCIPMYTLIFQALQFELLQRPFHNCNETNYGYNPSMIQNGVFPWKFISNFLKYLTLAREILIDIVVELTLDLLVYKSDWCEYNFLCFLISQFWEWSFSGPAAAVDPKILSM